MAQDPWAVVSQTPATPNAPTPTAPSSSGGGWDVLSHTPATPPSSPQSGVGGFVSRNIEGSEDTDPNWNNDLTSRALGGAIKSASQVLGNVLDFFAKPHPIGDAQPETLTPEQQRTHQHLQDAATWLKTGSEPEGFWENVGAVGEQVLEYMGTNGVLKMVGAGAGAAQAGNAAAHTTQALQSAQQVTQTLAKNPRLAGLVAIGLKASKDALMMGGQTYAHTEDPTQSAIAGAFGGAVRLGGEGLGAAGRWVNKAKPTSVNIAGEEVPALATQVNENGKPIPTGAGAAPKIAQAQQDAAPNVVRNIAQQATQSVLDRINSTRPVMNAIEDAGRMLPAPEGSEPFKFTLEGPPTSERTEGKAVQSAAKIPGNHAVDEPSFSTSSTATREQVNPKKVGPLRRGETRAGSGPTANEGSMGADIRNGKPPEAAHDIASGGGQMQTTDPREAESWLRQLEEIQQSPEHGKLSEAQQNAIEKQRQSLTEQLGIYNASPYGQRFEPLDVNGAVSQVRSFGDAADQIQASVKPVYEQLDRVSHGQFDKNNKAAKQALRIMRSATSLDAYNNAEQNYREATGAIDELLTRHAGDVSRTDYLAAKQAWRDSSRLNELHNVIERMNNGITLEESDQGFTRTMTGRTRQLQAYLDKGENASQLEGMIGKEGLTNLKQLTELMSRPGSQRSTIEVLKNVVTEFGRHARLGGAGGLIGGMVAHAMHLPYWTGISAGAMTGSAVRAIMHDAMVNPRIGNLVDYAVRNGVSPQVYAPLIARALAVPMQEQNAEPPADSEGDRQVKRTMVEPNPRGLIEPGNLPIDGRPVVQNADGTRSTEYSISFDDDKGREVLVPTVVNGKFLTPDGKKPPEGSDAEKQMFKRAEQHYFETGEHLGIFSNSADADRYAGELHNRGEK